MSVEYDRQDDDDVYKLFCKKQIRCSPDSLHIRTDGTSGIACHATGRHETAMCGNAHNMSPGEAGKETLALAG